MKLMWTYDEADLRRLGAFVAKYGDHPFVHRRRARNVTRSEACDFSKEEVWRVHLGCLLTTKQRSGAASPVNRLLDEIPFPLQFSLCADAESPAAFIQSTIQAWGGIRFAPKIGAHAAGNLVWLENGGWKQVDDLLSRLAADFPTRDGERSAARWLTGHLKGIGPKQSRNLLQWLGLTRQEIPLDSRVIGWVNDFEFPVRLSSTGLSDEAYYAFALDGIQQLCEAGGLFPCELDAMIFARDEPPEWRGGRSG